MNDKGYYSQNEEEKIILSYFDGKVDGRLAEIGAFHPTTFSNSRRLIEMGWTAVLVEPSVQCYEVIEDFYAGKMEVEVLNSAIGLKNGDLKFYDSAGACATAKEEHYDKWKNYQLDFKETTVPVITWDTFTRIFGKKFDFLSIDTEGMDWEVLQQIDLKEAETKLICIEYTYNAMEIFNYLDKFGFRMFHRNGENIVCGI